MLSFFFFTKSRTGDYQFDIYRFMRKLFPQLDTSAVVDAANGTRQRRRSAKVVAKFDWSQYIPRTNTLWLHYLANKLLNGKNLVAPRQGTGTRSSARSSESDLQPEIDAYRSLDLVCKFLDPRKKRFGVKKVGTANEIVTAADLVAWGRQEEIVYE